MYSSWNSEITLPVVQPLIVPKGNLHKRNEETYKKGSEPQRIHVCASATGRKKASSYDVRKGSRLAQIVAWMKGGNNNGDCMIILDECHRAKSLIAKVGALRPMWGGSAEYGQH